MKLSGILAGGDVRIFVLKLFLKRLVPIESLDYSQLIIEIQKFKKN